MTHRIFATLRTLVISMYGLSLLLGCSRHTFKTSTTTASGPDTFSGMTISTEPSSAFPGDDVPPILLNRLYPIYFDFDRYNLRPDQAGKLLHNDTALKAGYAGVILEGHCDERGTIEYNLALGQRRADAVRAALVRAGIPDGFIQTVSYGKERPVAPAHNETAWAANRRVEFAGEVPTATGGVLGHLKRIVTQNHGEDE